VDRHDALYRLAPNTLRNFRVHRYHGENLCLPLEAFTEEDRKRVRALYEFLQHLASALSAARKPALTSSAAAVLDLPSAEHIADIMSQFGRSSYQAQPSPLMAKTIHDIRGGGLTPLLGQIQLSSAPGFGQTPFDAIYYLTRDHLKIMRNALLGLDDVRREEDLQFMIHGTDLLVQKWNGAHLYEFGRDMRVTVECGHSIPISECCVEFGGLDRILYNLINNACRHAATDRVQIVLLPVPDKNGENIRFIILNEISPKDRDYLHTLKLSALFEERASTTGSGYGLAIAADFVRNAYGLSSHTQAIADGYLGAAIVENSFAAWFHWPRIRGK
jgi:signal transduction histidine kinase